MATKPNPRHLSAVTPPPAGTSLDQYPLVPAGPDTDIPVVYRVHDTYNSDGSLRSPLYYSSAWEPGTAPYTGGRFDLQGSAGLGTCNTGRSPLAAIREYLGTMSYKTEISLSLLAGKSVSRICLKRPIVLVDARVDGPGYYADSVSDARHKGTNYALTQLWAQGIYELGADGNISNSSLGETENVYLYGPAGVYEGDLEAKETVDLIEAYRECLTQGAGLPKIIEDTQSFPGDFGGALHDSLPPI